MTAPKAVAGGVAANVATLILWAISNIPGWETMPAEPKAAIIALVTAGVGSVIVYFAPANQHALPHPEPDAVRVRALVEALAR